MFRRQQIAPDPEPDTTDASADSRRSTISDTAWAAQDRLRSGLGEALRTLAEIVRWPFERLAWMLRRGVLWPIEDRAGNAGRPVRVISFAAVVVLAAGAGVAGLVWAAPDGPQGQAAKQATTVLVEPVADTTPIPPAPTAPTLHGASPVFHPAKDDGSPAKVGGAKEIKASNSSSTKKDSSSPASSEVISSSPKSSASSARASTSDGAPAGPAALAVARDFAGAFVLYETGKGDGGVRKAFGKTATPELTHSLMRRPPRLPANVKVPKAKVVNVVPGPSHGHVYTVSVSLLRVGLTSELRLDMEQLKGDRWRVTNVLG
jgi:hypothetical protein